jgi:hypothetical protein
MEITREIAEHVQVFDDPSGVLPDVRLMRRRLARAPWSRPATQQPAMRRLAVAQLGSAALDAGEFRARVVDFTIRNTVPAGLRAAAEVNPKHATRLLSAAERCEREATPDALEDARQAARAASHRADDISDPAETDDISNPADTDDDAAAAYAAHLAYATSSADSVAFAVDAVDVDVIEAAMLTGYAVYYAAMAASITTDQSLKDLALARDRALASYIDGIVAVLVEMRAPGTAWVQ